MDSLRGLKEKTGKLARIMLFMFESGVVVEMFTNQLALGMHQCQLEKAHCKAALGQSCV